jgi:hypothetical protein
MILSESEKNRIRGLYGLLTEQDINLKDDCIYFDLVDEEKLKGKIDLIDKLIDGLNKDGIHPRTAGTQFRLWGMAILDHTQDLLGSISEYGLSSEYEIRELESIIKHYKDFKSMYEYNLDYKRFDCVKKLIKKLYNISL